MFTIGKVKFVDSQEEGFVWDVYLWNETDGWNQAEPIAWIAVNSNCVEVHTRVSIEYYSNLELAAKAIEGYR